MSEAEKPACSAPPCPAVQKRSLRRKEVRTSPTRRSSSAWRRRRYAGPTTVRGSARERVLFACRRADEIVDTHFALESRNRGVANRRLNGRVLAARSGVSLASGRTDGAAARVDIVVSLPRSCRSSPARSMSLEGPRRRPGSWRSAGRATSNPRRPVAEVTFTPSMNLRCWCSGRRKRQADPSRRAILDEGVQSSRTGSTARQRATDTAMNRRKTLAQR